MSQTKAGKSVNLSALEKYKCKLPTCRTFTMNRTGTGYCAAHEERFYYNRLPRERK